MPDHPNLLDAIHQIVNGKIHRLPTPGRSSGGNPLTSGTGLEAYVKDRLAGVPDGDYRSRADSYDKAFCFQGDANHPPDLMYRGGDSGDAFEVKKTESDPGNPIQLNSSPPKDRLLSTNPRITNACRNCEPWRERDFFFIVGCVPRSSESLSWLWIADARLVAPEPRVFDEGVDQIRESIRDALGSRFVSNTNEIGRIEDFGDISGVNLRLRGFWSMPSLWTKFSTTPGVHRSGAFCLHAIMRTEKWGRYPEVSRSRITGLADTDLQVTTVSVTNPNVGQPDIDSTLIRWQFSP